MIHSSSRSRIRSSTSLFPQADSRPEGKVAASGLRRDKARCLVDLVDEILAETALHLLVDRHQLGDPCLPLRIVESMELDLSRSLDLLQRISVVLFRRRVEEVRRFLDGPR